MPLSVLGPLVLGGILGIVVLVHLMGWTARRVLDTGAARQAWLAEEPEAAIHRVVLADDGRAALLRLGGGRGGAVWCFGADVVVRPLEPGFARITEKDTGLRIRFDDPGAPHLFVRLADGDARRLWLTDDEEKQVA